MKAKSTRQVVGRRSAAGPALAEITKEMREVVQLGGKDATGRDLGCVFSFKSQWLYATNGSMLLASRGGAHGPGCSAIGPMRSWQELSAEALESGLRGGTDLSRLAALLEQLPRAIRSVAFTPTGAVGCGYGCTRSVFADHDEPTDAQLKEYEVELLAAEKAQRKYPLPVDLLVALQLPLLRLAVGHVGVDGRYALGESDQKPVLFASADDSRRAIVMPLRTR